MKRSFALLCVLLFASSLALAEDYPHIDISGYKKWEFRGEPVVDPPENKFSAITQLGGYTPTATGGPWQERLTLRIIGQLSEKLKVTYDVEQQPEMPDKYDVKVNYDNKHELTFGDFTATFSGNEFASATKYLNGVMITSKDEGYDFIAVPSAKLKSQIQNLTTQNGNNTKGPYSLGHGSIVEGSERVELNGVLLTRGTDYLIDYFEGKITFNNILTGEDEFSYSYEYTNIIDLFFPALSKKDFLGVQGRVTFDPSKWGQAAPVPKQIVEEGEIVFPTTFKSISTFEAVIEATLEETTLEESLTVEVISKPATLSAVQEEILEEESVGKYQLPHYPVEMFSEVLTFRGIELRRNEDYTIRYETGKITLMLPVMPAADDPLYVKYRYIKTEEVVDNISGRGSRGPYELKNQKLVQMSDRVFVNERLVVRDFDYTIDYQTGNLLFNYIISSTDNIKVSYKYKVFKLPPPPPPPKYPRSVTVGMTYLKESAKKGSSTATGDYIEDFNASDIISNSNTIYLSRFPLIPSAEGGTLIVRVDGNDLTYGTDYVVPTTEVDPLTGYARVIPDTRLAYINDRSDLTNGYRTGTIKILTTLESTSEVTVLYSYNKSVIGRFSGIGNGSRGPYYLRNNRDIIPGTEKIEVWETGSTIMATYVRNSSFEADAGDQGYSINYDENNPYVTFNIELPPEKNFSVSFQYESPTSNVGSDISQSIMGYDAKFKLGELIELDGAMAASETDQLILAQGVSETPPFTPNVTPTRVTLSNTPVIENSEKVYINGYLRNRDADYFIDYASGAITFYYVTLGTADAVTVDYEYQDPGGAARFGNEKTGVAYKFGAKSKPRDDLTLSYNRKEIDFDFTPLGGTSIGKGSKYYDMSANYAPKETKGLMQDFTTGYIYRQTENPRGARIFGGDQPYTRIYDSDVSLGVTPLNIIKLSLARRLSESQGDNTAGGSSWEAHSIQDSISLGTQLITLKRGVLTFDAGWNFRQTNSEDLVNATKSITEQRHFSTDIGFTSRVKAGFDHQISEPLTQRTTDSAVTARSKTEDFSYDLSLDLTPAWLQKLSLYSKLLNHEQTTYIPTPESIHLTRNTTFHTDLIPIKQLSTSLDYTRQETLSVVIEQRNPLTERTSTNVRVMPYSWITGTWGYSQDYTFSEAARENQGYSNTYTIDYKPIDFEKIKLDARFRKYFRWAQSPYGTDEVKEDTTNSFAQDYNLTLIPFKNLSITPGFALEDYNFVTTTSTQETNSRIETVKCRLSYTPTSQISNTSDYSLKTTYALKPTFDEERALHKSTLSSSTSYQVFDWGQVVQRYNEEKNGGEVQASGTISDINYEKFTNQWSLNFTMPQDNPILSSIVLSVNWKWVRFLNKMKDKSSESFDAQMWWGEGSLNF